MLNNMEQEKIKEVIDKGLNSLKINEAHKQELIHKCTCTRKVKINRVYKVASLVLTILLLTSIINNEHVLAAIKNLFTYSPLKNKVIPLEDELYQLEVPITINTPQGYIKAEGCEIQKGTIEFKLISNMDTHYQNWEESIMIRDEFGKVYPLTHQNIVGFSGSQNKEKYWTIEGMLKLDQLITQFTIITPFGDIPIKCTLAKELKGIDDIGVSAYDKEIYVIARKETEGNQTSVILNAFDKTFTPIEATFTLKAYDIEGKEIELDFGRNGKYYYPIPADQLAKIEVIGVEKIISAKGESFILEPPTQETKQYNKQVKLEDYVIDIVDGKLEEDIQLRIKVGGLQKDESCYYISFDFEYEEYSGYSSNVEGDYIIITILNDEGFPDAIKMKIKNIYVNKEGNWHIIF